MFHCLDWVLVRAAWLAGWQRGRLNRIPWGCLDENGRIEVLFFATTDEKPIAERTYGKRASVSLWAFQAANSITVH